MPGTRVRVPPLLLSKVSKSSSPKGLNDFVISGAAFAGACRSCFAREPDDRVVAYLSRFRPRDVLSGPRNLLRGCVRSLKRGD
jgi:hypothetical protein